MSQPSPQSAIDRSATSLIARVSGWLPSPIRSVITPKSVIPVVHLSGVIAPSGVPGPQATLNLATVGPQLERAFQQKHAVMVAIVINCPGGSPTQSGLIADRIRQLADEHQLQVVAVLEDLAASGGYWLACAADEIVAHPTSMVGSIGVVSSGFGFVELAQRLGIERRIRTAGANKARLDPFSPATEDDQAWLDEHLQRLHDLFIAWVTARRGDGLTTDVDVFTGDVWTGEEAIDLGLVDSLGSLHGIVAERHPDAKLLDITPPVPLVAKLLFGARRRGNLAALAQLIDAVSGPSGAEIDSTLRLR